MNLEKINKRIAEIEKQTRELFTEQSNLSKQRYELKVKKILDDKILSKADWLIRLNKNDNILLKAKNTENIICLSEDHHSTIYLTNKIKLAFLDCDCFIDFSDQSEIKQFIIDQNLTVENKDLTKLLKKRAIIDDQIELVEELFKKII